MGIVNRIVKEGEACIKALELAQSLAKFPQSALNHDRNSLYSSVYESSTFQQAIQTEIMLTSRDIIEEMQAGIKWYNRSKLLFIVNKIVYSLRKFAYYKMFF